jgi:hypothetical protein
LDVQPANTSWHLSAIRALPLRRYRLGDDHKIRIGIIGPEVSEYLPDAVEILHKRSGQKGQAVDPIDSGYPTVNEHTLFMYGIGATKELASQMEHISTYMKVQRERITELYQTAQELQRVFNKSSDDVAELRMKESFQTAEIARMEMEIARQRMTITEEYLEKQRQAEYAQIELNEKLTSELVEKERLAAKMRAEEVMLLKLEASQEAERVRYQAAEELSKLQHEKNIALQKATEEMKIKTAKVCEDSYSCRFRFQI